MKHLGQISTILILGPQMCGKSTLIRDILLKRPDRNRGLIFSSSKDVPFYSEFVSESLIFNDYQTEIFSNFYDQQRKMVIKDRGRRSVENSAFVVFDDINSKLSSLRLFGEGSFYNIFTITSIKWNTSIRPYILENSDFYFIFSVDAKRRKRVYLDYAKIIPNYKSFCVILEQCTKNRACLVIKRDYRSGSDWRDQIFWYKVDNVFEGVYPILDDNDDTGPGSCSDITTLDKVPDDIEGDWIYI